MNFLLICKKLLLPYVCIDAENEYAAAITCLEWRTERALFVVARSKRRNSWSLTL